MSLCESLGFAVNVAFTKALAFGLVAFTLFDDARFFEIFSFFEFGQYARIGNFTLEFFDGALDGLVIAHFDSV